MAGLGLVVVLLPACAAEDSALVTGAESTIAAGASQPSTTSTSTTSSTSAGPPATSAPPSTAAPQPSTDSASAPEPADASAGDEAVLQLRGRSFAGTTVTESGRAHPLAPDTELTVRFHRNEDAGQDNVAWSGGCNWSGCAVTVTGDRLDVKSDGGGSAAGCTDDRHAQDAWFGSFFDSDPHWSLDDGVLRLTSGETVVVLAARADAASAPA